jgi:DNA-binding MarR family transcriptional regulator
MIKEKTYKSKAALTDFELWKLLDNARSAISRPREIELDQFQITPEQVAVLRAIADSGDSASIDEIADKVVRRYNSVATLLKRMIEQGLVSKSKTTFKKKSRVVITEKGNQLIAKIPMKSIEMAFSVLSPKEKEELASSLEKLKKQGLDMMGLNHKLPFL